MPNDRMNYIGASDFPAIMGMSPYKSPLQLWAEKTGQLEPDDLSDNQAVEWGTRLERIVSQKFSDDHEVKLIARKTRYVHPEHSFISCELDNIIAGTDELVEIKTVNAWAWKQWSDPDELPAHVIVQVMVQLGLSKRKIGWVACLCGGQKYIEKKIEFDQKFYDIIIASGVTFWKMVVDRTPPIAMGMDNKDVVLRLNPSHTDEVEEANDMNDRIRYLQEVKMHIENLIKEKDDLEAIIKERIGGKLGIVTDIYSVTWKSQKRRSVDTVALKVDMLYDRYSKETETRVLRITNAKK
ncbi:YqaJ viral recombinase family protein [Sulfuricurvum sp.]|uniref:YqaJ viral recombinase family nuclease n=1 Tax=Sulfuricurvum sp. TaxID=2025608 RepID=UPI0035637F05